MIAFLLTEYLRNSLTNTIGISIVIGIFSTSRIVFFFIPLLLAGLHYKHDRRNAITLGILGSVVCLVIHMTGYVLSDYYQPVVWKNLIRMDYAASR